ncbi:hypothetical protein VP01_4828g2 [Puccinia sorghi]|uniref:SAM domain-containing protein n=1 Tax=Puccinia sorghi TaxID=27349 RepID=A0A0L6UPF3_9BASI|nr:hypothetical protein VP01_4828g2 [Puccinia sorghi]
MLFFFFFVGGQSKPSNCQAPTVDAESSGSVSNLTKWLVAIQQQNQKSDTPPSAQHDILATLLKNDIDSYKMSKYLTIKDLKALGLNIGIITKLCSNIMKYKFHPSFSLMHLSQMIIYSYYTTLLMMSPIYCCLLASYLFLGYP